MKEVTYIGHRLTPDGVKPDERKVEAIKHMPPPEDKKGDERLLGIVNYLAKFIPNMSTITKPIRELLKDDVEFQWGEAQEQAFQEVKDILTNAPVLAYYNVKKPVTVTCDASKYGLGAALLQEDKPVAFASRALTDAETWYAQIEKELLAVVFAFEKFNQYTYARCVEVETDHKPLVSIVKKSLTAAPPRLQRMLLRLQLYEFKMKYKPEKEMIIADTLSRAYLTDEDSSQNSQIDDELEGYVHTVVNRIPASAEGLEEIRKETASDETMKTLTATIRRGWPESRKQVPNDIQDFWNYRDELSEVEGILLKQDKIIIPPNLRVKMLEKIHQSHFGMEKCKRRARDIMFWPRMNEQIGTVVSKCDTCQEYQMSNPKEPMVQAPIPSRPWEIVATDLFQWEQNNYMVVVDYYSRYIEIARLENTTSKTVVNHTKSIFARHGIPEVVRSDNGPQYTAMEYKQFAQEWKFEHQTSSPYYPKSNGLAEKAVRIVKGLLSKSKQYGKDPYLCLLEYRNTPIGNVASPAQVLMSRRLRSHLPTTKSQLKPQVVDSEKMKKKLEEKQLKQKQCYDKGSKKLSTLEEEDSVRVQVKSKWKPAVIKGKLQAPRSYIVQMSNGHSLRRNRQHIKKQSTQKSNISNKMEPIEDDRVQVKRTDKEEQVQEQQYRTRSGRISRLPDRYSHIQLSAAMRI